MTETPKAGGKYDGNTGTTVVARSDRPRFVKCDGIYIIQAGRQRTDRAGMVRKVFIPEHGRSLLRVGSRRCRMAIPGMGEGLTI